MQIRALTIFISSLEYDKINSYVNMLKKIGNVWTKRISFPETKLPISKVMEYVPQDSSILFSVCGMRDNDYRIMEVIDALRSGNNIFCNILINNIQNLDKIAKILTKLEPEEATRLALLINDDFLLTPYFPASTSNVVADSFGLALLYVKDFIENKISDAFKQANEFGLEVSKKTRTKFLGIDVSLSPWMDDSVGYIIEKQSGKIFSVGNTWAVGEINKLIFSEAWKSKVTPIGFSETMLPIAEDNILKKRVEEGSLTLSQLIQLTFACAAGIDMVAINEDLALYKNLIKDLISIQFTKKRPYGIRIIPSRGEDKINTKDFGIIPTIKVI
jgi:uncharacterized protein (UPF0210 family)